jgi:hypothetical protein
MVYLTETGLISIITIGMAFLSAVVGVCYKSKCSHIKCCYGCMDIDRDIKSELKEDLAQLGKNGISRATTQNELNTKEQSIRKLFEFRRMSLPGRSENVLNQV